MTKLNLVFIPAPGMGHIASTVEMANTLVSRDHRLSATILAMKLPYDLKVSESIHSLSSSLSAKPISFLLLPEPPNLSHDFIVLLDNYKPLVKDAVAELAVSTRLAGLVVDMFCTAMIDVGREFEIPSYVFFTGSAGFLAFSFYLEALYSESGSNEAVGRLLNSDAELALPCFVSSIVPRIVTPYIYFNKHKAVWFHNHVRRFRSDVQGILVNSFEEMEPRVVEALVGGAFRGVPRLYYVGPVLHLEDMGVGGSSEGGGCGDVLKWLDDQPPASVVFVCFGTLVSFDKDQMEEIALGLERSGARFVWSVRQPQPKGKFEAPRNYADVKDDLPEGFLDRTAGIGRVIGWVAQVEILAHPAIGGFVSHCGWNSILESLWHGVPVATWPMHAEQQLNAFEMVVELGLAVEITLDYRMSFSEEKARIVSAEEIESGIRKLLGEGSDEMRRKVKAKSEECKRCVAEGGSSFVSLGRFMDDLLANAPQGRD